MKVALVAVVIASLALVVRAEPSVDQAYERLRLRQQAREAPTTQPVTRAELDRVVADLQKQVEALRQQVQQLQNDLIRLKEQKATDDNRGRDKSTDENVAEAVKKGLIVVGMTRKQMDTVLNSRGVTTYGGFKQSERLINGKSVKTEIIRPNLNGKNYGVLPTEIEMENDVVVRVEGLHL